MWIRVFHPTTGRYKNPLILQLYVSMTLFKCANIDVINDCRLFFMFELVGEVLEKKRTKFMEKFAGRKNLYRHFDIRV